MTLLTKRRMTTKQQFFGHRPDEVRSPEIKGWRGSGGTCRHIVRLKIGSDGDTELTVRLFAGILQCQARETHRPTNTVAANQMLSIVKFHSRRCSLILIYIHIKRHHKPFFPTPQMKAKTRPTDGQELSSKLFTKQLGLLTIMSNGCVPHTRNCIYSNVEECCISNKLKKKHINAR